jgi:hypothetical protein
MEIRNITDYYVVVGPEGVPIIRTISVYGSESIKHFLSIVNDIKNPKAWEEHLKEGCRVERVILKSVK